jgi:transposase InsO family protein
MAKTSMEIRVKAVVFYTEGKKSAKEICSLYGISDRTLRRWVRAYRKGGLKGLTPQKTGPKHPSRAISVGLEQRIIDLKQKYPHWGARRIKYQFDLPVHWKTVHNVFKRHGLLIRVKARPQPSKRFQRKHVDSMWQCDTFQFRISGTGKVYVTGFTDDCSRYRVRSKAYLKKGADEAVNALRWALRKGRKPREVYLDNAKQFISGLFKDEAAKHGIRLIFGRPYNPKGRGKIECYHKSLYRELVSLKRFSSLSHFRRELWKFDQRYNHWRKQQCLDWKTPASIYNDERYFNKRHEDELKSGHKIVQQKRT